MKLITKLLGTVAIISLSTDVVAVTTAEKIEQLSKEAVALQQQIKQLQQEQYQKAKHKQNTNDKKSTRARQHMSLPISVHVLNAKPELISFQPSALMAGNHILTYIAGVPVVSSPYLGSRPAFDGSDLIVNISSINQDVRLMMQRNAFVHGLKELGYPEPDTPVIAISGKIEPYAFTGKPYQGRRQWDLDLGSAELNVAAAVNSWVEGFFSFAYDASPPALGGRRINNSTVRLGKGFLNVGNLDRSPFYFTAGQLYVPFGRYSSSMVSAPLPMIMSRTMARTMILGFRHQQHEGLFGALFGFKSDTTQGNRLTGGVNLGYDFAHQSKRGEIGVSLISSINDAGGMQNTPLPSGQFGGFGVNSTTEAVKKVPAIDLHANINVDAVNLSAEWVRVAHAFRQADLSFNDKGASPQSLNLEAAYTFKVDKKPASIGAGYSWSSEALALGMPKQRLAAVFNVSLWRDTVQAVEFRHDIDYSTSASASGINNNGGVATATRGTGRHSNTLTAQFGIYF